MQTRLQTLLASLLALILAAALSLPGCSTAPEASAIPETSAHAEEVSLDEVPAYAGDPAIEIDGNEPAFTDADIAAAEADGLEAYAELDELGRCGAAIALVGPETMPTEEREGIGMVKPSGWQLAKYDFVDGKYLFNRCHLIGFQLAGENANVRNLITGTRYMNVQGMLPYENAAADYVKNTGNHVLFRATPVFNGDELVARGVQLEAISVEDGGSGVRFNAFCYNVQPGVEIDYATGENREAGAGSTPAESGVIADSEATPDADSTNGSNEDATVENSAGAEAHESSYVLNTRSMKFHNPNCSSVDDMAEHNKQEFTGTRAELASQGYEPCGRCNP